MELDDDEILERYAYFENPKTLTKQDIRRFIKTLKNQGYQTLSKIVTKSNPSYVRFNHSKYIIPEKMNDDVICIGKRICGVLDIVKCFSLKSPELSGQYLSINHDGFKTLSRLSMRLKSTYHRIYYKLMDYEDELDKGNYGVLLDEKGKWINFKNRIIPLVNELSVTKGNRKYFSFGFKNLLTVQQFKTYCDFIQAYESTISMNIDDGRRSSKIGAGRKPYIPIDEKIMAIEDSWLIENVLRKCRFSPEENIVITAKKAKIRQEYIQPVIDEITKMPVNGKIKFKSIADKIISKVSFGRDLSRLMKKWRVEIRKRIGPFLWEARKKPN